MNRFYAWWLVKTGKAIDIWSKSKYPAYMLSNLHDSIFIFDDVECHCMEGFLQSLKHQDEGKQHLICKLRGIDAKRMSSSDWQRDQIVWWKGKAINRQSEEYVKLITEAYAALYQQNQYFREALLATKGKRLLHSRGKKNSHETILTEKEFCTILTELRDHDRTIGKGNSFIINDVAMYQEFMNKDNNSILEYLDKLGQDRRIYSEKRKGLVPLLTQYDFCLYATEWELALVLMDNGTSDGVAPKKELVSDFAVTCELFRNRLLRLMRNIPHVYGILVTADLKSDYRAMREELETLDIEVIYGVNGLEKLSLPINNDTNLPIAFPMMFLFEAEFSENDILYASHHLQSKMGQYKETQSQEEIAAEMGINLADFGLDSKTIK